MNYRALIQNRKSTREFSDKAVSFSALETVKTYYETAVRRLVPELKTELYIFGTHSRAALEGAAGYNLFLVGAPHYLVLLSEKAPLAHINAGYMMEDLILKLTDMDLATCWLTFTDSTDVKAALGIHSDLEVAAIAAFGVEKKTVKRLRLNIRSMSNVDTVAKHRYMEPKKSIQALTSLNTWGNIHGLEDYIGFYDDTLWEALYAASLSPSYLNRQAYGFLLHDGKVSLVSTPDDYNTKTDGDLSLGAVLLHFTAAAEDRTGILRWRFGGSSPALPEGHTLIATAVL